MKFKKTDIEGCYVIAPEPFADDRGVLRRHFDAEEFRLHGIASEVAQCNISENIRKYTLRGFHYMRQPYRESKTISCLKGAIHDIVVDLRPGSKTFMKWLAFQLTEDNRLSIHVPAGCANAFLTTEPNTVVHYYHSEKYKPEAEGGIRYDDAAFKFVWPHEPAIISDKDRGWPDFRKDDVR